MYLIDVVDGLLAAKDFLEALQEKIHLPGPLSSSTN